MGVFYRKWVFLLVLLMAMGCASDEEKKLSHFEKGKEYFCQ